jgi:probable rRNA maturation factor
MNKQHLNHNTLTDIITFDYSKENKNVSGDIFISIDRVKENAKKFEVVFENELRRVMIHGVLHIMGYKDKKVADKKKMRAMEEKYLSYTFE